MHIQIYEIKLTNIHEPTRSYPHKLSINDINIYINIY